MSLSSDGLAIYAAIDMFEAGEIQGNKVILDASDVMAWFEHHTWPYFTSGNRLADIRQAAENLD